MKACKVCGKKIGVKQDPADDAPYFLIQVCSTGFCEGIWWRTVFRMQRDILGTTLFDYVYLFLWDIIENSLVDGPFLETASALIKRIDRDRDAINEPFV